MSAPHRPFVAGVAPDQQVDATGRAWWFVFRGAEVLIYTEAQSESVIPRTGSLTDFALEPTRTSFLGHLAGEHVYAAELPVDAPLPDSLVPQGLRALYGLVDDQLFALAGRA